MQEQHGARVRQHALHNLMSLGRLGSIGLETFIVFGHLLKFICLQQWNTSRFNLANVENIIRLHLWLVTPSRQRRVDAKPITSLQHIRVITRSINLLLATLPLWLVDGVNPVLDLHHQAPVLGNRPREVRVVKQTLRLLERHRPVLAVAAVELVGLLIAVDVQLDAGPGGLQARDEAAVSAPVVRPVLLAVDEIAGI